MGPDEESKVQESRGEARGSLLSPPHQDQHVRGNHTHTVTHTIVHTLAHTHTIAHAQPRTQALSRARTTHTRLHAHNRTGTHSTLPRSAAPVGLFTTRLACP